MEGSKVTIIKRTIVELDLVGYSDIARYLEEHLDANAVMQLNRQIQSFVDEGLLSVNIPRSEAVNSKAGDNAIVVFERVTEAHRFAEAFLRITEQYNTGKTETAAKRHFRLGISTGQAYAWSRTRMGGWAVRTRILSAGMEGPVRRVNSVPADTGRSVTDLSQ